MKRKSFFSWLINPFTYLAGGKALCIGLFIQLLSVFLGNMSGTHFDGAIDVHLGAKMTLLQDLLMWVVSVTFLVMTLYISGLILTKNFRFIDLFGTVLIARTPFLILAIVAFFVEIPSLAIIMADPFAILSSVPFLVFIILSLPLLVWHICLLYHAYKVSVGLPTNKAVVGLILAIVAAEILSKTLIINLIK